MRFRPGARLDTGQVTDLRGRRMGGAGGAAIGVCGGFVVSLTSVGSGVFFALWLLIAFPLK